LYYYYYTFYYITYIHTYQIYIHNMYAVSSLSFGVRVNLIIRCLYSAFFTHRHLFPSSCTSSTATPSTPISPAEETRIQQVVGSLLFYARALDLSIITAGFNFLHITSTPPNMTLPSPIASSTMSPPNPAPTKPFTPLPWLSGPAPTPAFCPAVRLVVRLGLETLHYYTSPTPPECHRQSKKDKQFLIRAPHLLQSHPSHAPLTSVTHIAFLHAFCQRIPMVVASVAEAEYAGQVLVELTLTLTNLGYPQQSPPLLFFDNECAIGLQIH
jgi:hypothetical protein